MITVLNATNVIPKLITVFVLIMGLYTAGTLVLMYFYWKRSLNWRFKDLSQNEKYMDSDVALHAIEIKKVP